jgi:glutamate-1-semialdehyde 2,1-aminomutase
LGGGFPIGALSGKKELMEMLAPSGNVYQAGTFNGNPISITAGLTTLKQLNNSFYSAMDIKGDILRKGIQDILEGHNLDYQVAGMSSMFQIYFTENEVWNYEDAKTADTQKFTTYFKTLLKEGVFVPPSQFECCFLSKMHDDVDIQDTLNIIDMAMKKIKDI